MAADERKVALEADDALALLRSVDCGRVIGSRSALPDAFPIRFWCSPDGVSFAPSEDQHFRLDGQPHVVGIQAEGETSGLRWTVMAVGPAKLEPAGMLDDRRAWDGSRPAQIVTVAPELVRGVAFPLPRTFGTGVDRLVGDGAGRSSPGGPLGR